MSIRSLTRRCWQAAPCLLPLSLALPAAAQCGYDWQAGPTLSATNRVISTATRALNGDLIVSGPFVVAGNQPSLGVARWDGTSWSAMGSGLDGGALTSLTLPNGDIALAGTFANAGGAPAGGIAAWNGQSWQSIGGGTDGYVYAMIETLNGDLVIGGNFSLVGGQPAALVARWNGSTWSGLPAGLVGGTVRALLELPNGDLLAGGFALNILGQTTSLAQWDGTSWSVVSGFTAIPSRVNDMALLPSGDVAMTGIFSLGQNASVVAWDGSTLQNISPPALQVRELAVDANGMLLAGGTLLAGSTQSAMHNLQRFDGATWTPIGENVVQDVEVVLVDGANLTIAGANAFAAGAVAEFDGQTQTWTAPTSPAVPLPYALKRLPNGDVVIGGSFDEFGGVAANNIVRWDGSSYHPLASGVDGSVMSLAIANDGSLIIGGHFLNAGGAPARRVARWDGNAWSTLGNGLPTAPSHMAVTGAGEVIAAGNSAVHRFSGSQWTTEQIGVFGNPSNVVPFGNGNVALTGIFLASGITYGAIVYDGTGYSPIGSASTPPSIAPQATGMPNGDLVIKGAVGGVGGMYRWDGSDWQPLPNATGERLSYSAEGDLFLLSSASISRLSGSAWESIPMEPIAGYLGRFALSGSRELFVAGSFLGINGVVSARFARGIPNCPATVSTFGAGCTGSAGALTLSASSLPWLDSTVTTTASGFPASAIGLHLVGLIPTIAPLPLGAPGCSLFVAPILTDVLFPVAGEATAPITIPNIAALVGVTLRSQVVGIELDAQFAITQTTATNGLELTVGGL